MADAQITISATDLASDVFQRVSDALKATGDAAHGVSPQFESFGDQVRTLGDSLKTGIEDPMGAIKTQAAEMLEGMGATGIGLVAFGGVVLAAAAACYELTSNAAAAGGAINDIAEKTGVSVPMVDRYAKAFEVAGGSAEQFSSAMFMLQKNIGEGGDKIATGLDRIGLSVDQLKAAGPDHYMELIAEGFKSTEDPAQRSAAAMDIFNRSGREILPMLSKLGDALQTTADIQPWTDEQSKAAEHFEMQIASMKIHAEAWAVSAGRNLIEPVGSFIGLLGDGVAAIGNFSGALPAILTPATAIGEAWRTAAAALADFLGKSEPLPKVSGDAARGLDAWKAAVHGTALAHYAPGSKESLAGALYEAETSQRALDAAAKESIRTHQQQAEALAKEIKAVEQGNTASLTTIERLIGVAGQIVNVKDGYKAYEEAVREVQRVEEDKNAYSMRALEDLNKAQAKANKTTMDDTLRSLNETEHLWRTYYDLVDSQTLSATDYKKLKVKEWFDDEVAKLKDDDQHWGDHYDAIYAMAQIKTKNIEDASNPYFTDMKTLLLDLTDGDGGWEKTFSNILVKTHSFGDAAKGVFDVFKTDVLKIFGDILEGVMKGFFAPLEAKLGGFLASLFGGGGSGGGGWWAGLLGLFGHGGDGTGSTPIQNGYFDGDGVWRPIPGGGTDPTGSGTGGPDVDVNHPHESLGGLTGPGGVVYASRGWGEPFGTDTVRAWLTPGERVLPVDDTAAFERAGGLAALHAGDLGGAATMAGMRRDLAQLHALLRRNFAETQQQTRLLPRMMAEAVQH